MLHGTNSQSPDWTAHLCSLLNCIITTLSLLLLLLLLVVVVVVVVVVVIPLMQGIYTYTPDTNHAYRVYSVAAVL